MDREYPGQLAYNSHDEVVKAGTRHEGDNDEAALFIQICRVLRLRQGGLLKTGDVSPLTNQQPNRA